MNTKVARDAPSAWATLCDVGGLEPNGRDADITDALKAALNASSATLEEALLASSTDDLVRAFFNLVQPFAQMFRSVLDFFKAAGAREGRSAWVLKIEETHLDLTHFQQFLEGWDALICEVEVPAIDSSGALAVFEAAAGVGWKLRFRTGDALPITAVTDVDSWLEEYARGQYAPFPPSLHPARLAPELADPAAILMASVEIIRRTWPDRAAMLNEYRTRHHLIDDGDAFNPRTIAQHETDHRVAHAVTCLALASRNEAQRRGFSQALARVYERYPRRKIGIRAELPELERLLALPLWQRRHELYAVWIATEIVNALDDHRCQLHHDDGRITFAFRKALVATVHTTRPKVRLYTERRTPLTAPVGHARKGNVQPDYGLWRGSGTDETCQLVIEVKHYKKGSSSRFRDVLTDYARAHPHAQVLLVCHGPADESLRGIDSSLRHRCSVLRELTPSRLDQRSRFRQRVRECVGQPVAPSLGRHCDPDTIVAIDSAALQFAALGPEGFPPQPELVQAAMVRLVMAHEKVEEILQLKAEQIRYLDPNRTSHLRDPVLGLIEKHRRFVLVTDSAGLASLKDLTVEVLHCARVGTGELRFIEVRS
jgi:hypothetical protein